MQAAKNMAGMVKHKVEDAAATVQEKKDVAKADAKEKKEEATNKKVHKEKVAEENKDQKVHHERQNPIGDCPTPADLDMPVENPSQPSMKSGKVMFPQTIVGPSVPITRT